jgi:SAM-dependent methyltransferase
MPQESVPDQKSRTLRESASATVFNKWWVARHYRRLAGLQAPEKVILNRFLSELSGKRILDIGVGAGRTTEYLMPLADRYVGIDISPAMIAYCRRRFPSGSFEVCSATDLSRFANHPFDVVLFSYNGLDCLDHTGRLRALDEIRHTLVANGLFVFSAHNRAIQPPRPWKRELELSRPFRSAKTLMLLPRAIVNHLRKKSFEIQEEEYAVLNDQAHGFNLLHYYISIERQVMQLETAGFRSAEAVGLDGRWLQPHDWPTAQDAWIYYTCRSPSPQ